MPLEPRAELAPELRLPPPYSAVRLREFGDAFTHAVALAPERGAGLLVHVGRFDLAEFALVLEPEEPLRTARRVFYAGMAALIDALATTAQPETSLQVEWPDAVYVNLGLVGGGRLAWPKGVGEDKLPPWLVFGAMIRTASVTGTEPGANPDVTALDQEGFGDTLTTDVIESFARNFMVAVDDWQANGFGAVAKTYLERLPREKDIRRAIDDNGDLLIRRMASSNVERRELLPVLKKPSWYDAKSKGPR